MVKALLLLFFFAITETAISQTIDDVMNEEQAKSHISFLASDSLKGRINFSKEQLIAAKYISNEFRVYGLSPFPGFKDFYQPFHSLYGGFLPAYTPCDSLVDSILYNVVGVLPGKTRSDEAIIFSAHYDHVYKGLMGFTGELYNGANDNASGVAAVLMLAKYFANCNNNDRTIIFCLFSGEELGLYGSKAFANMVGPNKIKAVINIEMIGRRNAMGQNSFFITGSRYSDLVRILKKNLRNNKTSVRNDWEDHFSLYYRSDNFPFAKRGIPAHTIMCSDDREECYHKPCDDVERIDFSNMTKIVRAIALGCKSMIRGEDTPTLKK